MNDSPNRDVVIFTEATRLPADERAAYLASACGGDAELRQKVEALLHTHEYVGDFLEASPQKASIEARVAGSSGEKPGDRIGRYKLLQQIGEGGWGVVFMAEQDEPVRRKVALKIVKPGMDTKNVVARFEAERQALALMDHPNIAHVFDAGATENGRPYFVMELVRGARITDYCDQSRMPTAERLELFIQVCSAVQHAHQKGIIHRDIKPSNILVTTSEEGKPLPKVIDFGIAKATTGLRLTDKTLFTAFEMLIGTPAYMSPEQAALTSLDVDTRTDIYSLGVLLYELLTSTTPFDTRELLKAGLDEVRRVIQTEEPVRPSTRLRTMMAAELTMAGRCRQAEPPKLIRSLKGDLDWIVMKTLEKDRTRRYQTATGIAEDIRHYLAGDTVSARPPSAGYKFHKLIARNKLVFSGVSLIFVLLLVSLIATTRWLMIERQMQEDTRQQLEIARLESQGWSLLFDANHAEAEQTLRKVLDLRKQSHRAEVMPVIIDVRLLILEIANQRKFDEIRPLLSEFVDPALLSEPEYKNKCKDLYQFASFTLASHGKWNDADAIAEELARSDPTDFDCYHRRAPLLAAKGDVEEYRRVCGEIVSRFRNTTDPYVADKMAKDCLILPVTGVDLKSVAALADVAVTRGSNAPAAPYFKFCKALAEYRLGHYQAATNWAALAIQGQFDYPRANAATVMAMSQFKLNQLDSARTTLAYCNKVIEEKMPQFGQDLGSDWPDWIIAHALLTEAQHLLGAFPARFDSPQPQNK